MESDNGFGAGIEAPADDPFADTSMEEFDQSGSDPLADTAGEQPPLVNREGERIEPGVADTETQVESPEEQAMRESAEAELAAEEQRHGEADPIPAALDSTSSAEPGAAAGSEPEAVEAAAATAAEVASEVVADPQQADAPASSATQTSEQTTQPSPAARDAAAPAESPADAGPTSASATQTASTDEDRAEQAPPDSNIAPMPEEKKDKNGAITHRRYILLTPEGNGKHREVSWYEDKAGKIVKKGTPGAKKQSVCLARGQEEALAVGYQAMGSPDGGVPLRAVALTYWGELTNVEPEEQPVRQRLKFRR